MKKHLFLPMALALLAIASCTKEDQWIKASGTPDTEQRTKSTDNLTAKDHIKIAVLSDIHYMDQSLILENGAETGTPFRSDARPNKALQAYSDHIFEKVADELAIERPDILLIAGDMAKDGEEVSHIAVAKILTYLQDKKEIKVYVTPGNNDINNSTAKAYTKTGSFGVPNVTPERFTQIYGAFGYNNAIKKDNYSLSYVAQPYTGLWILSIDAAKYDSDNRSGAIRQRTMEWIIDVLAEAKQNNTTVLALMHHNTIEHFTDQNKITVNTVIEHWETASDSLIDAGLKVIFTGHNHAIDITTKTKGSNTLYDVETGSLITPPSSYRIMTLKNKELDIDTRHLTSIDVPLPDNEEFTAYSHRALSDLADEYFTMATKGGRFYLPVELRKDAIPLIRNAYMAHMAGDEKLSPLELAKITDLYSANKEATQLIVGVMKTLWTDLNTKDHKWHIKLTNP